VRYVVNVYRDGQLFKSRTTGDFQENPKIFVPVLQRRMELLMRATLGEEGKREIRVTVEPFEVSDSAPAAEAITRACLNCQASADNMKVVEISVAIGHGERTPSYGLRCGRCGWRFAPKVEGAYAESDSVKVIRAYNRGGE
jgi:hypothetical protein